MRATKNWTHHAQFRFMERYSPFLSQQEMDDMASQCANGISLCDGEHFEGDEIHRVKWREIMVILVYSRPTNKIITVLPHTAIDADGRLRFKPRKRIRRARKSRCVAQSG